MEFINSKTYQLLYLLDRFGIMKRKQILERLDITEKNLRISLNKLEEMKFIKTYKEQRQYSHFITTKGSEFIGRLNFGYTQSDKEPNFATLRHNLMMNDASKEILEVLSKGNSRLQFELVTEREILANQYLGLEERYSGKNLRREKAQIRNKIPDFRVEYEIDSQRVVLAYELELTRKTKKALVRKLQWYNDQLRHGKLSSVIYIYDDWGVYEHVALSAAKLFLPQQFRFYRFGSKGEQENAE
ncbi:MarR family winged helix-turn-helix transcriptional regulator [Enterococcus avium]|uniref:MarR family winged helix-turn-helix transcriptional regulator n=1 Tax=Enterococcus avium TaxID=33945 RepID=UPI0023304278|nr:MarR family winged helix-turn-helix transcriptional regulator [Enterococcus avium]MDB1729510.1 MarR family winged helix-turn-helix transcriptional regulator [Enterococcus avium]MDB1733587.1 MarR family winged helix-turn-helix transcriptional regulator [Enterococcus avium]